MAAQTIYITGTISFVNGQAAITGVGTSFLALLSGDPIQGPDGKWYELDVITSDTQATLERPYAGATATNQVGGTNWVIFKSAKARDSVRTATKQLTDVSATYRQVVNFLGPDQTLRLNKATSADDAGQTLQKAGDDIWQMGSYEDDDYSIRFKLASVWTKALSVSPTTGHVSISQALLLGAALSPPLLTADANDYAPLNFSTCTTLRLTPSAARNLTGLAGGTPGRLLMIVNVSNFDLTLKKESASSAAANRFGAALDIIMAGGQSCLLIYDAVSQRWRPMAGGGGGAMSLGTVTTGAAGSAAAVTNSGSSLAPIWNFTIPRGDQGPAATIAVNSVTTGAPGSSAAVANGGTPGAALLDFTIPRGDVGATGPGYLGTSASSLAISVGSKTFATQAGMAFQVGQRVRASNTANGANYMEGFITAYAGTSMTVNVVKVGGSGTLASWAIGIAGEPGTGDVSSVNNLSDLANASAARGNLGLGSAATQNIGTSGGVVPLLNGANTYDKTQTAAEGTLISTSAADFSTKQRWKALVSGGAFTIANPTSPVDKTLYDIAIDFTTTHSISFGSQFKLGDYTPTATAGKKDRLVFEYDAAATAFYLRGYRKDVGV